MDEKKLNDLQIRKAIGKRIKEIRKKKSLSQLELANLMNSSQSHIANIETGKRRVSYEFLSKIANVLGTSVFEIIGEAKNSKKPSIEDIAWEIADLYLENIKQEVSNETRKKLYEFILYEIKRPKEDIEKLIKLLTS